MKIIGLTQGKETKVDDIDYGWLSQWKWYAGNFSGIWYAVRRVRIEKNKWRTIFMHRLISQFSGKTDHKNNDGLDNQRHNLRTCTTQQNAMNRKPNAGKVFKGVYFRSGKYESQIKHNSSRLYLGTYKTKEEAAWAYDNKAKELFGEFANLNFK